MIALAATLALSRGGQELSRPAQGANVILGDHGQIHIQNFRTASGSLEGAHYAGTGNPMIVEDSDLGLRMEATTMDCTLANDAAGQLMVTKAIMDGKAQIWIDTGQAAQARGAEAIRQNRPPSPPARQTSKIHLVSGHIVYEVAASGAVATCTQSVDYTDDTVGSAAKTETGQTFPVRYDQTIHVSGAGGTINLTAPIVAKESDAKPKTMHMDGPVKFDLTRNETSTAPPLALPLPKPPPQKNPPRRGRRQTPPPTESLRPAPATPTTTVTVVHGAGDRFDADFVTDPDPHMTLAGNVTVDAIGPTFAGTTDAGQAVVTLDRVTEEPKKYDFTGQPAVTDVKTKGPVSDIVRGKPGGGRTP